MKSSFQSHRLSVGLFLDFFFFALILLAACLPEKPAGVVEPVSTATVTRQVTSTSLPTHTPQPTPTATLPPQLQVNPDSLNGLTITFLHPWLGDTAKEVQDLVEQFNATNLWGITVQVQSTGGESALYDQLMDRLIEENPPHLVAAPIQTLSSWERGGPLFVDLNTYAQSADWGLTDAERADFNRVYWLQDQIDGRQVGIPALRTQHVLFYNRSWAHELGFYSDPTTLEEFQRQACAAAAERADIDQTGGYIIDTSALTTLSWLYTQNFNGIPETEDDNYQFNSARGRTAFNYLWSLSRQGCSWVSRDPSPYAYFANRQALFYSGTLSDILAQTAALKRAGSSDEWTILPYPGNNRPVVISEGPSYAILETTFEEQLAAWMFVRWMILPRNQAILAQAQGILPASASAASLMADFRRRYPQWEAALPLVPLAQPAPRLNSWHIVHMILEDATWQMYQSTTTQEMIPAILSELDATILEVLQYQ